MLMDAHEKKHLFVQTLACIAVPDEVQAILDLNVRMNPTGRLNERFVEGIRTAVEASLEYKPTAMRHTTDQEIKRRVTVCMEIFKQLYFGMDLSIIRFIDVIPRLLVTALEMDQNPEERAIDSEGPSPTAWSNPTNDPVPSMQAVLQEAAMKDEKLEDLGKDIIPETSEDDDD